MGMGWDRAGGFRRRRRRHRRRRRRRPGGDVEDYRKYRETYIRFRQTLTKYTQIYPKEGQKIRKMTYLKDKSKYSENLLDILKIY